MARILTISILVIVLASVAVLPVLGAGSELPAGIRADVAESLVSVVVNAMAAERCDVAEVAVTEGVQLVIELPDCWLVAR